MNPHHLLSAIDHRPYPLPRALWAMTQTWSNLLFAHWPVATAKLRDFVPKPLRIDEFEGTAWIGVIPFQMTNVVPRGLICVPHLSNFLELNVRTYVTFQDKPGVYFFSLDASNPVAVLVARMTYFLPYFQASMTCSTNGDEVEYTCKRTHRGSPPLVFQGTYRPIGPITYSNQGSLEYFLTERYCLFVDKGSNGLFRADIHHVKWPLQSAEAEIRINTMAEPLGFNCAEAKPILHFAKSIDTIEWAPVRSS
ncbi:MAG: hypothetical protein C5B53_02445 [Candidatus Melainabacteria bacterium]|nr:MAG: hypothetical protein C5B53_02445 [Candidatus Melainabacteria bacterium]